MVSTSVMTAAQSSASASEPGGGVFERVRRSNAGRREAPALFGDARSEGRKTTYGALFDLADAIAAGFLDLGVRRGDRIGIASENFDLWAACDLAALSIGAVTVP